MDLMRQSKSLIRAPKIALQQELKEKQKSREVTTDHIFTSKISDEEAVISFGNLIESLFSRQFIVTMAIIVIIVIFAAIGNALPGWLKMRNLPHHSTALPFEMPPEIESLKVPVSEGPAVYDAQAEAFYIEGNKLMAAGLNHRAEKLFRQAAEQNPGEQRYWNAWQAVRREADFTVYQRQIEAWLEAERADEAWQAYLDGVQRDRRFFNQYTPDFAEKLVDAGYLASATSILLTYHELFPVHHKAKSLLEKIRSIP